MADESKTQTQTKAADSGVTERQALDNDRIIHGRPSLKDGYQYHYESIRNADGKLETVKVVRKA